MTPTDSPDPDGEGVGSAEETAERGDGRRSVNPLKRLLRPLTPLGVWIAGIAAALIAAMATAWLPELGFVPHPAPDLTLQSPATASMPAPSGGLPFTVAVKRQTLGGWVIDQPLAQLPPRPRSYEGLSDWAREVGGIPADDLDVYMTVQGRSEAQVTLTNLRVRVTERRRNTHSVHVNINEGGPDAYRWVRVDLDTDPPKLSDELFDSPLNNAPAHERRPIRFPYEVSISDAETFLIKALANGCDCSFLIELDWMAEGKIGTVVVDDAGRPFRLAGSGGVQVRCTFDGPQEICQPV